MRALGDSSVKKKMGNSDLAFPLSITRCVIDDDEINRCRAHAVRDSKLIPSSKRRRDDMMMRDD